MGTPGVSVSARVLINTSASRRGREMEWLQVWVWVQRRGRWFSMWTFRPLPCVFVLTPMNADPAWKNHLLAVDIHHAIWLPSTFLVLFLGLKNFQIYGSTSPRRSQNLIFPSPFAADRDFGPSSSDALRQNVNLEESLQSQEVCWVEEFWWGWKGDIWYAEAEVDMFPVAVPLQRWNGNVCPGVVIRALV